MFKQEIATGLNIHCQDFIADIVRVSTYVDLVKNQGIKDKSILD
jgi:hypothetical protein